MPHAELEALRGLRTLVTGGAGFIGSHVAALLRRHGAEVTVLDDLSNGLPGNLDAGIPLLRGDIRSEAVRRGALRGIDVVFHLAAQINPARAVSEPLLDFDINARATLGLLCDAEAAGVRRLVLSSTNLYGDVACDTPYDEATSTLEHPMSLLSPYAASKLSAEAYCKLFSDTGRLTCVRLRYSNVYGPRQRDTHGSGVLAIFARAALQGRTLEIHGDGLQTRDFVHVDDVAHANLLAALRPGAAGHAINIAAGTEWSVRDLAALVLRAAGGGGPVVHRPDRVASFRHARLSIDKAERLLGWRPSRAFAQSLAEYVGWLRADLGLALAEPSGA